jgi:hypothetical protein
MKELVSTLDLQHRPTIKTKTPYHSIKSESAI